MDAPNTLSPGKEVVVSENTEDNSKEHLVVFVHGLHGAASDFDQMIAKFSKKTQLLVYCSRANEKGFSTHHGVDVGGKRLAEEIENFVAHNRSVYPNLKYFSMIGHSLGGLYSRYCIGLFHEKDFFSKYNLVPKKYISLATPHVGSRRTPRSYWNWFVSTVTRHVFSVTGKQLMLEDSVENPLLLTISEPESIFIAGLKKFENRVCYANVVNDIQVPYSTAAISAKNPYLQDIQNKKFPTWHPEYKYIVHKSPQVSSASKEAQQESENKDSEATEALAVSQEAVDHFSKDEKKEILLKILKNLNELEWEKVDVYYPSYFPHDELAGKLRFKGAEAEIQSILQHILDQFNV